MGTQIYMSEKEVRKGSGKEGGKGAKICIDIFLATRYTCKVCKMQNHGGAHFH